MATVMITGGHKGLGLAAADQIAGAGFDLLLAGRQPTEMEEVAARLRRAHGVNAHVVQLDVSSLQSVRRGAARSTPVLAAAILRLSRP